MACSTLPSNSAAKTSNSGTGCPAWIAVVYNRLARSTMVRAMTLDEFCGRLLRQGRSNAVFSRLHYDPEVRRWTEVADAEASWGALRDGYDAIMAAARRVDVLVRHKEAMGFPIGATEIACLHAGYSAACRVAKTRGIAGGSPRIKKAHIGSRAESCGVGPPSFEATEVISECWPGATARIAPARLTSARRVTSAPSCGRTNCRRELGDVSRPANSRFLLRAQPPW